MIKLWMCAAVAVSVLAGGPALAGEARITDLTGEAFLVNKDGIHRVRPGVVCEAGDMIMTRGGCQLNLMVNGQAGCRLLPNTIIALASIREEDVKLLIAEGNIVLNVKKQPEGATFTVDTPTAVAAVRGTQFWGRVAGDEDQTVTTFAVKEGALRVMFKESGQTVEVGVGQAVDLGAASGDMKVRTAAPDEMAAMRIADEIASQM